MWRNSISSVTYILSIGTKTKEKLESYKHVVISKPWWLWPRIGHFRVLLCLCFKTSLSAKPFIWKWVLHAVSFSCQSSHFHKNGFALRIALKQRHKGTRKWPISLLKLDEFLMNCFFVCVCFFVFCVFFPLECCLRCLSWSSIYAATIISL